VLVLGTIPKLGGLGALPDCCRRAQTETERAPKLSGSKFINKPAATQQTHVQRLSPKNKGGFPYLPFRAGYRNGAGGYRLSHT
jgi:hypothetical protein